VPAADERADVVLTFRPKGICDGRSRVNAGMDGRACL
jgi:hypothetical protein